MVPQPKLTVVDKVPNIPFVLLGLNQWIHTREATVLRHAMTARAKVICTSRISSIYNTHGRTGSDWGRTGDWTRGGEQGVDLEVGREGWTGDRTGGVGRGGGWTRGVGLGVGLEWSDRGSDWGSDWGGRTGEVGLGSDEVAGKISQVSLRFADMSSDVNVVHPTCPSLGKVKFGSGKVTFRSITVTTEAVTTS